MNAIFDSRDPAYKTPFGAVPKGEKLKFFIKTADFLPEASLELLCDADGSRSAFALSETDGGYGCELVAPKTGLWWYRFSLGGGVYLGRGARGAGALGGEDGRWFQQTVYSEGFSAPPRFRGGVMYQIFPDSFNRSGDIPATPERTTVPTSQLPDYRPDRAGRYCSRCYGGDLEGIRQKLGYLSELGVTVIYLNPIFEAHTSHRYDTADYLKIDPMLGCEEDFRRLAEEAKKCGISLVLDGVFSHTGDDSVYFNKYGRYGEGGAYRDPHSKYYKWYKFTHYPEGYKGWWGIRTLPEINEDEPSYTDFICGDDGVLEHWLSAGASGFRLDVADELPDDFIERIRARLKKNGRDALLIGEVWEDATTKVSYGEKRRYLFGKELDSVMNYPLRRAILDFMLSGDAEAFREALESQQEAYPKPVLDVLMNMLSTHDTERVITALGAPPRTLSKDEQREYLLPKDDYLRALELVKLATVLQFTVYGLPCVYYGDEIAMQGFGDPFCRAYYDWNSGYFELKELIGRLSGLRRRCGAFADGELRFLGARDGCVMYTRGNKNSEALIAVNRGEAEQKFTYKGVEYTVEPWRWLVKEL